MNQEISSLSSSTKLTSKRHASMEKITSEPPKRIESSQEMKDIQRFEMEMEQINYAFMLVREIRHSIESALRDLSPK